jgi:hypothetical protein
MLVSDSYVLSNIIEITKDENSRSYWESAIRELGEAAVEEELGEMKMRLKEGRVIDPARYLTSLLQKLRKAKRPQPGETNPQNLQSYLSPSAMDIITELRPRIVAENYSITGTDRTMERPYSSKQILWATFLSTDFFTLSTNKNKSDVVTATFRTGNGDVRIPLLRGCKFPGDSERGILTAEHGKVLGALENYWAQQGCKYMTSKDRTGDEVYLCYCTVSASSLIRFLGKSSDGSGNMVRLKTLLTDLQSFPYYLKLEDVDEFKHTKIRGYGFTLLASSTLLDINTNPGEGTIFKIVFSETYSRQLLGRRVTTRSLDLVRTKSELAFLVHLYLEPILIKRKRFQKALLPLLHDLQLPPADWHKRPGARKQQFAKAIDELCNKKTGTDQTMRVRISKNKTAGNDYILEAYLVEDSKRKKKLVTTKKSISIPFAGKTESLHQLPVAPEKSDESETDVFDNLSREFDSLPEEKNKDT